MYFSWLERQIAVLNVVGSSPILHPSKGVSRVLTPFSYLFVSFSLLARFCF